MMTRHEDYKLQPPPSSVDITGNIIPVADVDGKTPALRLEDAYYIREMFNLFKGGYQPYTSGVGTTSEIKSMISSIKSYFDYYPKNIREDAHLIDGAMNYSGVYGDYSTRSAHLKNWMNSRFANKTPSSKFAWPNTGSILKGDLLREAYYLLKHPAYFYCQDVTNFNPCPPLRFTTTQTQFEYTNYIVNSSDGSISTEQITATIHGVSGYVSTQGHSQNSNYLGVQSKFCYAPSTSEHQGEYYINCNLPSVGIDVPITFNMNVANAYAIVTYSSGSDGYGKSWMIPLEGSGKSFKVMMYDRTLFDEYLAQRGISPSIYGTWSKTSAVKGAFCDCKVEFVLAKFDGLYTALPADWTWQPS